MHFRARRSKKITLSECEERDGKLYYRGRLAIPNYNKLKLKLLRYVHDSSVSRHLGRGKTLEILQREYYQLKMFETVRRYVSCYYICRRIKVSREKYNGFLKPLPVLQRRQRNISVDFIVELPESKGYTNIIVVVDRLSKYRYILPCKEINAKATTKLFY